MWAIGKLGVAPVLGVDYLLAQTKIPGAGTVAAFVAIALIVGSALMIGYFKAAADKGERLLGLAREETLILNGKVERLESENALLRGQPNLEQHARLLQKQLDKSDIQIQLLREIRQNQEEVVRAVGAD